VPEHETFPVPTYRFWGQRKPPKNRAEFWNATTEAPAEGASSTSGKTATLRMYGPIDSFGGWFGISAKDVAAALDSLPADVDEIRVRINSPGGEAFEGMAILNMLRAHQAKTVAVVDGLAASAASFLASGLDETVMSPGSQMMIHDAAGLALGQASDMRKMAEALDSVSNSIASIYAEATGETTEEWRAVMVEETWYTADEAVSAGLADQVAVVKDAGRSETAGGGENPGDAISDAFDLSIFNYAGRDEAPAPHMPPSASAVGSINTAERGSAVAFSDEQLTTMRQELGLAEDADEATIVAALSEALSERAEPPAAPGSAGQPTDQAPPPSPQNTPTAPGTMVIDSSAWEEREARIKRLEAQDQKRRREERDQVIANAVSEGKFPHARKDHWTRLWDADPEGTRQVIDGLMKGVVPVNELGHAGDDESIDDEFGHLFPPSYSQNGA
jgi:ATP-dependent Clp endopeptidase proteolytic subunit ClpP